MLVLDPAERWETAQNFILTQERSSHLLTFLIFIYLALLQNLGPESLKPQNTIKPSHWSKRMTRKSQKASSSKHLPDFGILDSDWSEVAALDSFSRLTLCVNALALIFHSWFIRMIHTCTCLMVMNKHRTFQFTIQARVAVCLKLRLATGSGWTTERVWISALQAFWRRDLRQNLRGETNWRLKISRVSWSHTAQ